MSRDRICIQALIGLWGFVLLVGCNRGKTQDHSAQSLAKTDEAVSAAAERAPQAVAQATKEVDNTPNQVEQNSTPRTEETFRPDDQRPSHDDARLADVGIRVYESTHLKLYTDIDADVAATLPGLIDQLYPVWERELGPLPPDRRGKDFQITGYLMRDSDLFHRHALVPEGLTFEHGRNLKNEFWMREQRFDYYRRHLLIHEATHCYMTYMPDVIVPLWYMEGMAEYFATHRLNDKNEATFQVMPTSEVEFQGFGRIKRIRDDIVAKKAQSIPSIFAFEPVQFRSIDGYSWSWALCSFLDRTPRYHDRFQKLAEFTRRHQFDRQFMELFSADERDLSTEWALFTANLQFGYEFDLAAIEFRPGTSISENESERTVMIDSHQGWQSSHVQLEQGATYEVAAIGEFTLADQPVPWLSEPQGITYRYFGGHPLGMLVGCIRTNDASSTEEEESMLRVIPFGDRRQFESGVDGTLYLRLNDAWNSLHDNKGHVKVIIRRSGTSRKP